MKKFLFTLATLLMAGSLCAEEYFYIPDFEVKENQLGTKIEVYVAAHYDYAVSAWDVWFDMPEGLSIDFAEQGEDMTISYTKANGRTGTLTAPFYFQEAGHYITAVADPGYYQVDGAWVSYGAVKWLPGDYEEMIYMELNVAADFKGGDIVIKTQASCGEDPREDVTPCVTPTGDQIPEKVCHVTVEQVTPPAQPAPVPTFDWSDQSFTMEAVCEDHTVVLMKGDETVSNPFTVTQTYEEQEITFKAYTVANDDESGNSAVIDTTVVVPAKAKTPSQKPSIVVTPGDDKYTIEATGDGTVKLYLVDGETLTEVNNPYEVTRGDADVTLTFIASNLDTDPENEIQYEIAWSAEEEVVIPAKVVEPKVYETPEPVIVVTDDPDNEQVIVKVTGEGAVTVKIVGAYINIEKNGTEEVIVNIPYGDEEDLVNIHATALANLPEGYDEVTGNYADKNYVVIPAKTPTLAGEIVFGEVDQATGKFTVTYTGNEEGVTITLDDETIVPARVENTYQLPDYGTYEVTATASAPGYKPITEDATLVWTKTEPGEKPGVPKVVTETTDETVTVSASAEGAADEDVTIYLWDPEANNGEGDFVRDDDGNPVTIDNPSVYNRTDEEQSFMVKARATNDAGETWSDAIPVIIPAKTATGVDELVNGKTVAGVRYFNMAGQEMQEANGVTIVVTTYTDGTTSAVKVIK
jgi:hypothetical protein